VSITVKTAASRRQLADLEDVKEELRIQGNNYDNLLSRMIDDASAAIEEYCDRIFASQTYVETLPGSGGVNLSLYHFPITSITSIKENGTVLDSSYYVLQEPEAGIVFREAGWGWSGMWETAVITSHPVQNTMKYVYEVEYVAGFGLPSDLIPTLPKGIERAAIIMVKDWYQNAARNVSIKRMRAADAEFQYDSTSIPPVAMRLLSTHRREA
jgi:hypothetical protein